MTEYKPPARVMALASKVSGVPIAHGIRPDGSLVIVFEDGRKLCFAPVSGLTESALPTASIGSTRSTPIRAAKKK